MASHQSRELEDLANSRWLERARKARAKEKREKDLRQILRRNNLELFLSGSFEHLQVCEEIQGETQGNLINPSDMNMTQCKKFPEQKREVITMATLTGVLAILKERKFLGREWQPGDGMDAHGRPNYTKQDVLNLRLVSKSWKEATEFVFMNDYIGDWHLHFHLKLGINSLDWRRFPNALSFSMIHGRGMNLPTASGKQIFKAMSVLRNSSPQSVSALISTIHIDDRGWKNFSEFSRKLTQFLLIYGPYVQGLLMKLNDENTTTFKYQRLLDVVTRLPNLKALVIEFTSACQNSVELKEMIKQCPFPNIPSLGLLRFDGPAEESLVFEILEKSQNLKSVKLPSNVRDFDW